MLPSDKDSTNALARWFELSVHLASFSRDGASLQCQKYLHLVHHVVSGASSRIQSN